MAGCIEDLLAYPLGDLDWLKDSNRSPFEDRLQGLVHITSMLPLQHIDVACATCDLIDYRRVLRQNWRKKGTDFNPRLVNRLGSVSDRLAVGRARIATF
jgi:hypothetical protein